MDTDLSQAAFGHNGGPRYTGKVVVGPNGLRRPVLSPPTDDRPAAAGKTSPGQPPTLTAVSPVVSAAPAEPLPAFAGSRRVLSRGIAINLLQVLTSVGVGVVLTPLLLHRLGAQAFGVLALVVSIAGYVLLLEGGIANSAVRRVSSGLATGDVEEIESTLACTAFLNVVTATVGGVLLIPVAFIVGDAFRVSGSSRDATVGVFVVCGGQFVALAFQSFSATVIGAGRPDLLSFRGIVIYLIGVVAQVTALETGLGFVGVVLALGLTLVLTAITTVPLAARALPGIKPRLHQVSRAGCTSLLSESWRQTVVATSATLAFGTDTLLLGIVRGPVVVATYAVAARVTAALQGVLQRGSDILMAPYANLAARQGAARATERNLFQLATAVGLGLGGLFFTLCWTLGHELLALWLGSVPHSTYACLVALAAVLALQSGGQNSYAFLVARADYRWLLRVTPTVIVVNIPISLLASIRFGAVGPALGTLAVAAVVDSFVLPGVVLRHLGVAWRPYLRLVWCTTIGSLVASTAVGLLVKHLATASLARVALGIPLEVAAYGVVWASLVPRRHLAFVRGRR